MTGIKKLALFTRFLFQILRQQLFQSLDGVVGDAFQDGLEPFKRFDIVDLAG